MSATRMLADSSAISYLVYLPVRQCDESLVALGFDKDSIRHYGNGGAHAVVATMGRRQFFAARGTEDLLDVIADLRFRPAYCELSGGCSHFGFRSQAESLRRYLADSFSRLGDGVDEIVYCGHSLGGAVAAHCAMYADSWEISRPGVKSSLVTFGCPLIGTYRWCAYLESLVSRVIRVTNDNDPVPRVPLWPYYHHPGGDSLHFRGNVPVLRPTIRDRLVDSVNGIVTMVSKMVSSVVAGNSILMAFIGSLDINDHRMIRYRAGIDACVVDIAALFSEEVS